MSKFDDVYNQFLIESYVLDEETTFYKFDEFKTGKIKKLLIIGLTGGGKSTLGNLYQKKYKTDLVNLDDFDTYVDDGGRSYVENSKKAIFKEYSKPTIIEGIVALEIFFHEPNLRQNFKNMSIIIMGTSVLKSSIRSMKRHLKEKPIIKHFLDNMTLEKELKEMRQYFKVIKMNKFNKLYESILEKVTKHKQALYIASPILNTKDSNVYDLYKNFPKRKWLSRN